MPSFTVFDRVGSEIYGVASAFPPDGRFFVADPGAIKVKSIHAL